MVPTTQLLMRRPDLAGLPAVVLPPGYQLRTYQPGDEQSWLDMCNPGIGTAWTLEILRQKLLDVPFFTPERLFFAVFADQPVATACAWQTGVDNTETGYMHMVVTAPEHQRHGLGRAVTVRVLHYFREHEYREVILHTDDFRLPAIRLYQDLGFERVIRPDDEALRRRWDVIDQKLAGFPKKEGNNR